MPLDYSMKHKEVDAFRKRRFINEDFRKALRSILDIMWQEEENDFLTGEVDLENHAYSQILILDQLLGDGKGQIAPQVCASEEDFKTLIDADGAMYRKMRKTFTMLCCALGHGIKMLQERFPEWNELAKYFDPPTLEEATKNWQAWGLPALRPEMTAFDKLREIQQVVNKQADDEALWFDARTAPEAYVQQALRKLHKLIEE